MHNKARTNLNNLKIRNIHLIFGDGSQLEEINEKYDAILLAAAPLEIPRYLVDKLSIGGKLTAPIGDKTRQKLTVIKRQGKKDYKTDELDEVLFVPLIKGLIE